MIIAHHTYSWQYPGLVFADSCLDGENAPIVKLQGRDWIDSTSQHRYEVIQNARLWGIAQFYMPYISEGGFSSTDSKFLRTMLNLRHTIGADVQFAGFNIHINIPYSPKRTMRGKS